MRASNDVARRLTDAREEGGLSIRQFQKKLTGARVPGASYPNVHAILQGDQAPSIAFLEGAARVLRVSAAWLAFGVDPRPPATGIVADAARFRAAVPNEDWLRRVTRDGKLTRDAAIAQWQERQQREEPLIRRAEAANADYHRHAEVVRAAFKRTFSFHPSGDADEWAAASRPWYYARWRFAPGPKVAGGWVEIGPSADLAAARAMGRALAAPLRALGIKYFDVSPWQLHQYVTLVSAALEAVLIGKAEVGQRRAYISIGKKAGDERRRAAKMWHTAVATEKAMAEKMAKEKTR